jgi:hypothetical protein
MSQDRPQERGSQVSVGLLEAAFLEGARAVIDAMGGPRVNRPEGISDEQWINCWGAKRREDGTFLAPMSCAHLIPNPANSKPAKPWYRALAEREAAIYAKAKQP